MRRTLSTSEKQVIFALCEDADRTDSEIARRMDMKESTVGENRRNLLKKDHFEFINVPAFHKLGFELIALIGGTIDPALHGNITADTYRKFFSKHLEIYDAIYYRNSIGCLGAFENIASMISFNDQFEALFKESHCSKRHISCSIFPFDISRMNLQYNLAPCLKRIFDLDIVDPQPRQLESLKRESISLSDSEKRVLIEIISHPEKNDAQIARGLRRSRQRVTDIRTALNQDGLFKKMIFPHFESAAIGAMAYVELDFSRPLSLDRKISMAGRGWTEQSFLTLERDTKMHLMYPLRDMEEYQSLVPELIGPFMESGLLMQEPSISVVSTDSVLDMLDYSYGPLIKTHLS